MHSYAMFHVPTDPRFCVVKNVSSKLDEYWLLSEGTRMGSGFPLTTAFDLAQDNGDLITDFVNNIHKLVMVSEKARAVLEAEGVRDPEVEYLEFILKDKKGRRVKERFFVANVLRTVPCFDWERSVYETYPDTPQEICMNSVRKLHIHEDRVPAEAKLFRMAELTDPILIRSDLLERLEAEGCTGMSVVPLGQKFF